MIKKVTNFLTEVKVELTKVSWASRQELIGATMVVFVLTAIMVVLIYLIDMGLGKILTLLLR